MTQQHQRRFLNCLASLRRPSLYASILAPLWLNPGAVQAQTGDSVTAPATPSPGFQIRSISGYGVYYSHYLPGTGGIPSGGTSLASDFGYGGSVEFDWMHFTERSTFSLVYTPSFTGLSRYSSADALNHSLTMNATGHIAPRWTLGFSVSGALSTFEQSLFAPSSLSTVASLPATFQDFASGLLQGQFTNNPLLGSVVTSAPVLQSPLNTLLYGERMFTASARTSLSYSYSPRLSLTFDVGGSRTQPLSDSQQAVAGTAALGLNATTGSADVTLSYSLSPRTQIGGSFSANRTSSSLYDLYTTTSQVSVGRTFAHRWILQVHGGAGATIPVRQTALFSTAVKPYPSGGGSLTYKTSSNTFIGSYDRTVNSSYGTGAATSYSANAAWRFRMPGRSWWMDSSLGWQQLQGGVFTSTSGWHFTAGLNKAVSPHVAFRAEYAYLSYSGGLQNSPYNLSQSAVRFSVTWFPPVNGLR